jgi:hypothetical protein
MAKVIYKAQIFQGKAGHLLGKIEAASEADREAAIKKFLGQPQFQHATFTATIHRTEVHEVTPRRRMGLGSYLKGAKVRG